MARHTYTTFGRRTATPAPSAAPAALARAPAGRTRAVLAVLGGAIAVGGLGGAVAASEFHPGPRPPASAVPGQCFGKVHEAGPSQVSSERVLVRPARTEQRWIPAVSQWSEHRVLVRPAWTETTRIPALYRTEVSTTFEPGPTRMVSRAPTYRRVEERVMVAPAHVEWRRGRGALGFGGEPGAESVHPTGEVLCRVLVPARYAYRVHMVQTSPGCSCEVEGAPIRHRVERQVMVRPERAVEHTHFAVYKTVRECRIVRPGHAVTVSTPALYRTVTHVHRSERAGWSQVVCPSGLAPWAMARMQQSLNARGYRAGPEDGQARPETMEALGRWQRDNRLPQGQITQESARRLGVIE